MGVEPRLQAILMIVQLKVEPRLQAILMIVQLKGLFIWSSSFNCLELRLVLPRQVGITDGFIRVSCGIEDRCESGGVIEPLSPPKQRQGLGPGD